MSYAGRPGKNDGFIYVSAAETAEVWAKYLQCESGPDEWQNEYSARAGLVCTAYSGC